MANTKSAKKAIRVIARKSANNRRVIDSYKLAIKTIVDNIRDNKMEKLNVLLTDAYKKIDKAAKNNIIHKNNAARKKSRLARLIAQTTKKK